MVDYPAHCRLTAVVVAAWIGLAAGVAGGEEIKFSAELWHEYADDVQPLERLDTELADYFLLDDIDESGADTDVELMLYQPNSRQQQSQRRRTTSRTNSRTAAGGGAALVGLSTIPYMIGDTGAGTCVGFAGLLDAELSHPSLTCSRLNISENNTPLPTDRVYYSYRHFHNSTPLNVYQFNRRLHVDRYTLGIERATANEQFSVEVRIPLEYRLTSEFASIAAPDLNVIDLVFADEDRRVELANISVILKRLLVDREAFALSGGLGVTLPTAQAVDWDLGVEGRVTFPALPTIAMDTVAVFETYFRNETVYLSPFLSWRYAPRSRWFHQGFLQFEFAANPSKFDFEGAAVNFFYDNNVFVGSYSYDTPAGFQGNLHAQTLMRFNSGFGYRFCEHRRGNYWTRVTGMVELHYTTTLEDATLTNIPINEITNIGTVPLQAIAVGNLANRVDILNLASGLSAEFAGWTVTNGAIVPLRTGTDRGFDFEYNLQAQRTF